VRDVQWLDDETNEVALIIGLSPRLGGFLVQIKKVKKIAIYVDRKLVIINPIEDSDEKYVRVTLATKQAPESTNVDSPKPVSA